MGGTLLGRAANWMRLERQHDEMVLDTRYVDEQPGPGRKLVASGARWEQNLRRVAED